ncbi:MAG: CHAT domain-containing protein, partial [Chloroflexota bacterium]
MPTLTLTVNNNQLTVSHSNVALGPPTPLDTLPRIRTERVENPALGTPTMRHVNPFADAVAARTLGQQLYAALGGDALTNLLDESEDRVLYLNTDDASRTIPWEYARTPDDEMLACDWSIIRVVKTKAKTRMPQAQENAPLNVTLLTADPAVDAQGNPRAFALDSEREIRGIGEALRGSGVALQAERIPPTEKHLRQRLRRGPALLHLSCHGKVIPHKTKGAMATLILEDEDGKAHPLTSERLMRMTPSGVLRMVVMSACLSAATSLELDDAQDARDDVHRESASADMAYALVHAGIPVAIGMQSTFPDNLSTLFAQTLFESLLAGLDVAEAMRQTRLALDAEMDYMVGMPVGMPVVYVGVPDVEVLNQQSSFLDPFRLHPGSPHVRDLSRARYASLPPALEPPTPLLGRVRELHQLANMFSTRMSSGEATTVVTVVGTGGMGKTALSGAFAQRFGWRFGGSGAGRSGQGAVGVTLADKGLATKQVDGAAFNPATVLLELLERLNIATQPLADLSVERLTETLLAHLRTHPALLFIDNYESVLDQVAGGQHPEGSRGEQHPEGSRGEQHPEGSRGSTGAEALHRAFAQLAQSGVPLLITSRQHPAGFAGEVLFPDNTHTLRGVDLQAGAQLFIHHSTRAKSHDVVAQLAHAALALQVADVTEGHPLAVALLAGEYDNSRARTAEDFLANWVEELAAAYRPGIAKHHVTFDIAFNRSFAVLNATQQVQLMLLSHFPAPFFVEGAEMLWRHTGITDKDAHATILNHFVQRSLLQVDGTFVNSDRPATYRLDPVIGRTLATRLAVYVAENPDEDIATHLANVDAEYARWLVQKGYGDISSDLGLNRLIRQWLDVLIIQAEYQPLEEKPMYCKRLGWLTYQLGRLQASHDVLAMGIAALQPDDDAARSSLLYEQATLWNTWGDLDRALALYEESLVLDEKLGDMKGKSASLSMMAQVYMTRGELDRALALYEESLVLDEKLGDMKGKSASLSMMAQVYMTRG